MKPLISLPPALLTLLLSSLPFTQSADLQIETTTAVTCSRPTKSGDQISVHYRGTLQSDGSVFDESYPRGQPITFTLGSGQVIEGWDEGLQDMCPGEARRLVIPPEMAYGEFGSPPVIPPRATLVFETELVEILGVKEEWISTLSAGMATTTTEASFGIATAPSEPPPPSVDEVEDDATPDLGATPLPSPQTQDTASEAGQCRLLGPFALMVQGALGAVALLALVLKRWRETPKRPWLIFFFDVSKQVVGSALTHILNLAMSILASVDMVHAAQHTITNTPDEKIAEAGGEGRGGRQTPNPCSFYILNLGIDTTLGIPMLYLLLKILHATFLHTPLARPPESIKSGHYTPSPSTSPHLPSKPRATWWLKQCLIYFLGLTGMKLFVLLLFALLPWLPWIGDWALRWTEGSETLQIVFVMFVFPLAMNAVQYWIIDGLIMEKSPQKGGKDGGGEYERVEGGDEDDDVEDGLVESVEEVRGKNSEETAAASDPSPSRKEENATPIPSYEERVEASGSRGVSPVGGGMSADINVDGNGGSDLRGRR